MTSTTPTSDVVTLARYFSALIRAELSADEIAQVRERNRTAAYAGACATHDFRDANAYMFGAFAALRFEAPDISDEAANDLMDQAWDLARAQEFAL